MRGRSADRIENLIANYEVDVSAIGPERIVAGQPEIWTGLPPAVLRANHPISDTGVQMSTRPDASSRRRDRYPLARLDFIQCSGRRIHLDHRMRDHAPQ